MKCKKLIQGKFLDHYCSPFVNMISKTKMQISTCMMKTLIKVNLYMVWKRGMYNINVTEDK